MSDDLTTAIAIHEPIPLADAIGQLVDQITGKLLPMIAEHEGVVLVCTGLFTSDPTEARMVDLPAGNTIVIGDDAMATTAGEQLAAILRFIQRDIVCGDEQMFFADDAQVEQLCAARKAARRTRLAEQDRRRGL